MPTSWGAGRRKQPTLLPRRCKSDIRQTKPLPVSTRAPQRQNLGEVFIWSGRWDSNPRPSPWQGDALPLSHFRSLKMMMWNSAIPVNSCRAEGQSRTGDTGIFSAVLYHLSYLGSHTHGKRPLYECQGETAIFKAAFATPTARFCPLQMQDELAPCSYRRDQVLLKKGQNSSIHVLLG